MKKEIKNMIESPIIAVIRGVKENEALHVIEALMDGGINNIEVTFGETDPSYIIQEAKHRFKEDVLIGAGTVTTIEQVKAVADAGAQFVFSPNFKEEVVEETLHHDIISIPGCFSPSEIYNAYTMGADVVKVFPANVLGPGFIKDIKAPMPYLNIIPTGGINNNNMTKYIQSGAIAVGLGSSLIDKQLLEEKNYKELTKNAKESISIAKLAKLNS